LVCLAIYLETHMIPLFYCRYLFCRRLHYYLTLFSGVF
jgi:hypothetical protein